MKQHLVRVIALSTLALLAACTGQTPPTTTPPTEQPLIGASPSTSPSPAQDPSVYLQDSFEGASLREDVWSSFPQTGLIHVRDGRLELLNTGRKPNYPYVVTKNRIIPESGPFYFEVTYEILARGANVNLALDYLPAPAPGEAALTEPFLRAKDFYRDLRMALKTESGEKVYTGKGGYDLGGPHTLRLENDGAGHYRVILDQVELGTFESQRRPQKFWVGPYPLKDATPSTDWAHVAIHSITSAHMTTPASAAPVSPSPSPSPTPN